MRHDAILTNIYTNQSQKLDHYNDVIMSMRHLKSPVSGLFTQPFIQAQREREIKFIGLFEDRGHRGPYSPYKPFDHNLYIGIIIFPRIDNPQSTGYD